MNQIQQLIRTANSINNKLGLPRGLLVTIAWQENGRTWRWRNAVSPRGARGIMQLMDVTVHHIGQITKGFFPNPFDPTDSFLGAGIYLLWLHSRFNNWRAAIAAYNWGPGNVRRNIRQFGFLNEARMPRETRNYMIVADHLGL